MRAVLEIGPGFTKLEYGQEGQWSYQRISRDHTKISESPVHRKLLTHGAMISKLVEINHIIIYMKQKDQSGSDSEIPGDLFIFYNYFFDK